MHTNIPQIRNRLTTDLRSLIEHELESENRAGLYILLAGVDPGVNLDEDVWGVTHPTMSELYQNSIERYDGPGPCMALQAGLPDPAFTATAVHELSHILMGDALCKDPPSQSYVAAARQYIRRTEWSDVSPPAETFEAAIIAARKEHDLPFIRMAIHVSSRLCAIGWPIESYDLLDWAAVTNRPVCRFVDALRDEVYELRNEPLSAIKTIPPPAEFGSLLEPPAHFRPRF